ncbi:phosphoglycerate mutase-like protein [Daldinia decipiens]|uniref:phosphoglycerate mutase-like protein n=1 Tax=Daldinia decipiens TaxID=326647 RepID=UPI0020C47193|nr:phosphoglycerate mutase-like protein [Daldinia decipiens]KAI1660575.1 phosphoglycerate mutase-like protein [Daldinia decipiens]
MGDSVIGGTHKFSFVPGFFEDYAQIANALPDGKISTQPALGILSRDYDSLGADLQFNKGAPQWVRFEKYIQYLNHQHIDDGISYKLMYVIRHGRGIHNVKMDELKISEETGQIELVDGIPLNWKNHWSHKDGDDKVTWADAQLVDEGITEAKNLSKLWLDEDQRDVLPLPGTIYTSPLARCLDTTKLVYAPVMNMHGKPLRPVIKENLRERITDHTCDRRSSRSWIKQNYPSYIIEEGFSELDTSWKADKSESLEQHVKRIQQLLDDIFAHDTSPIISLTTHSYTITALLAVIGYPKFMVNEGTIVALFVKADKAEKAEKVATESSAS